MTEDRDKHAPLRIISRGLSPWLYKPCPYCGRKMESSPLNCRPTRDHVYPNGRIRNNRWIVCCSKCNHDKGNLWLETWLQKLIAANDRRAFLVDRMAQLFPRDQAHAKINYGPAFHRLQLEGFHEEGQSGGLRMSEEQEGDSHVET